MRNEEFRCPTGREPAQGRIQARAGKGFLHDAGAGGSVVNRTGNDWRPAWTQASLAPDFGEDGTSGRPESVCKDWKSRATTS